MRFFVDMHFFLGTPWSLFSRHSVINFVLTCNVGATGWEPSDIIEDPREGLERVGKPRNPWELSGTVGNLHFDRFFTRFRYQINQIWSYRGIHSTNRCGISRSFIWKGSRGLVFYKIYGFCQKTFNFCHVWKVFCTFSSRNRSGRGFMSSPLVGMTAWVSGLRKSSFWPKNPRKTRKIYDFPWFFPLVGSDS